MCKGLAVVAEKVKDEWIVYAKEGVKSHDDLLHKLRDDLRYGKIPHLKFEVHFPMIIIDDIDQTVAKKYYPEGWVEQRFGKWVACAESFAAVANHLSENKDLLNFDPSLLDHASLDHASLDHASLNDASLDHASLNDASLDHASLNDASLNDASLNRASLNDASLNRASLDRASLNDASLDRASLDRASLNDASLDHASLDHASLNDASLDRATLKRHWKEIKVALFAGLYVNFEYKTRDEVEKIVSEP